MNDWRKPKILPVRASKTRLEMDFYNQWTNRPPKVAEVFTEPTLTIPDQSMTIQEIIAKYTRTGLVPQSFARKDEGGNQAFEPDFDPLDQYGEELAAAAAAAHGSADPGKTPEPSEPAPSASGAESSA